MIMQRTILRVSDNSGAKTVRCIKVLGGFKRRYAVAGDFIIVSVQRLRNKARKTSKVKKKEIYKALILRTKSHIRKKDGSGITFQDNAVALVNRQGNPIATRILGPVSKKIKKNKTKSSLTFPRLLYKFCVWL